LGVGKDHVVKKRLVPNRSAIKRGVFFTERKAEGRKEETVNSSQIKK